MNQRIVSLSKTKSKFKLIQSDIVEIQRNNHKPKSELEIEELVINDMRKKIVNDDMNEIGFYQIQQIDPKKGDNNYRSIHLFSDIAQIRGTKFHSKIKRTELESRLRQKLAEEPGKLLLLREIYEKMEENYETKLQIKGKRNEGENVKLYEQYKPENDDHIVQNLGLWFKKVKIEKEMSQKKKDEEEEKQMLKKARSIDNTPRKRMSAFEDVVLSARNMNKRMTMSQNSLMFPKLLTKNFNEKEKEEQDMTQEQPDTPKKSLLKSKLMGSLSKLTFNKKKEITESDRIVNKKVEKYLHQGENLTSKDFEKLEQVKARNTRFKLFQHIYIYKSIVTDFSVEGLKRSLHTLIKMQITTFNNAYERASFYEKQTNQILISVNGKISAQEQMIKDDQKILDILMIENHDIHNKQRQIKELLGQLEDELKQLSQSAKDQKMISKANAIRNQQIDYYMTIVNKQNEIENDINTLKESYEGFQKKLIFNNTTIEQHESQIVKLQKQNKRIYKAYQQFLLELLKLGLDCRNNGLTWIIRKLWELEEKVMDFNLPIFLDSKAKEFLILKTKKLIDLDKLIESSHNHYKYYKSQVQSYSMEKTYDSINFDQNSSIYQPHSTVSSPVNFSHLNSEMIRTQMTFDNRRKMQPEFEDLLHGLTTQEKRYIEKTLTEITQAKTTLSKIIYLEAQKKLHFQQQSKKTLDETSILKNADSQPATSKLEGISDLKEKMINEYAELQKNIQLRHQQVQNFEEEEVQRLIKEIEFKNYLGRQAENEYYFDRFNVEALQVLAALFGYAKAERELIKNGMMKK